MSDYLFILDSVLENTLTTSDRDLDEDEGVEVVRVVSSLGFFTA